MHYSRSVAAMIAASAAGIVAQDMYYYGNQFDVRGLDDFYEYGTRDVGNEYDLGARGFDDRFDLAYRDTYDGYGLEARDFDDYTYTARSDDADDSLFVRDMFAAAEPQPLLPRSFFPSPFGNFHSLAMSPLSRVLNGLTSSAHRGHSHLMFANNHAFMIPPQHDPFDDFFDSFMPSMGHGSVMAHASVSSGTNGYACTSSTVIGADGIPHTTKHCSSNTPDSRISLTIGPDPDAHSDFDHENDFFSDKIADIWSKPDSSSKHGLFSIPHNMQKLLRNKRILDLDSEPHRGEIHSFSTAEDVGHAGDSDHGDEEDHMHDTHREKHDLRDVHAFDAKDILKRDAQPEAEADPKAEAEADTIAGTKP